jgi:predicted phosphodiesterase
MPGASERRSSGAGLPAAAPGRPRRVGIPANTADVQAQKFHTPLSNQAFAPLPPPTGAYPFRLSSAALGLAAAPSRVLHVVGDTGGVKDPNPQMHVTAAMVADRAASGAALFYHLGDVVYFNGDESEYGAQFYEPYAHYQLPIVAIPGNHDGDNSDDSSVASLTAFVANFCSSTPHLDPQAQETNRDTMDQPNVYWTLTDDVVTIVGLYTNVPEGGVVAQDQVAWLVEELRAAPPSAALLVALHHPPYSCDADHGGSAAMGQMLDGAFAAAGRTPDVVLSGHVHDYQRFTRTIGTAAVPYIVAGAGGYHNLHAMAPDPSGAALAAPFRVAPDCVLETFCADEWGFLRLTVTATTIAGEYMAVARDGTVTTNRDSFMLDRVTRTVGAAAAGHTSTRRPE